MTFFPCLRLVLSFMLLALVPMAALGDESRPLELWYPRPAAMWVEALPVGNGRLGAMVYGGKVTVPVEVLKSKQVHPKQIDPDAFKLSDFTIDERVQINEDSFWAGGPYDPSQPGAWEHLDEARRLLFTGQEVESHNLILNKMMARPKSQMPYQPAGDLLLTFPEAQGKPIEDYRRSLNLRTAVVTTKYTVEGVSYTRQVFSSPVDQVIVVRVTADKRAAVTLDAELTSPHEKVDYGVDGTTLMMTAHGPGWNGISGRLRCHAKLRVIADGGATTAADGKISVAGADAVTMLIGADTNHVSYQDVSGSPEAVTTAQLASAATKPFDKLLADHVAEHQRLFNRVTLDLGTSDAVQLPTDRRIKAFSQGNDPQLGELFFQYGRYLLISSSRPGCQPANLQGIWNDSLSPPWQSKYTCNINVEMNYWPAEKTNLAECHEPLFDLVRELSEAGQTTAKNHYNASGWVCHHNTDLWRASAPIDGPSWGIWPTGGAWLCQHLWMRYEFSLDRDFLAEVYPIMKGACEFFVDTLIEDPNTGYLVTCPSISPENRRDNTAVPSGLSICSGPTMDRQLLQDLFSRTRRSAAVLGIDKAFSAKLEQLQARLAPMKIGAAGQLQEWQDDFDLKAPQKQHRHVSHLYGLHPSNQIDPRRTPALFAAARKSLELRGDGGTGWSKAWKINFWARLLDGDRAYQLLSNLIATGTYPNLFDAHPPFQIDGNFGGANGILEMLLQSQTVWQEGRLMVEIDLLPALPNRWPTGSVTGVRARGGFELDLAWRNGKLQKVTFYNPNGAEGIVRYSSGVKTLAIPKGGAAILTAADF